MKMRMARMIAAGSLVALGLVGCKHKPKDTSKVLATVAGEQITENQFMDVVKVVVSDDKQVESLLKSSELKEQRNQFLESLALQKSTLQMAKAEGLDKDPKLKAILDQRIAQTYMQALVERRMPKGEPTDADLKTLYDSLVQQRKAEGNDKGLPAFEDVKAQLPGIWKQRQEQDTSLALFKDLKQKYPITFAEGYQPTSQPGQP
ncbi:MAG TPA: hypothetical protein VN436_09695 [Holophaga sp.]|nr:hypothetical protein [Holophaga sp.]